MNPQLPTYQIPGDEKYPLQHFVATERYAEDKWPLPTGLSSDDAVRSYVAGLWETTYRAMEPEHSRMNRCERYYSGRHYDDARENRENEITNYAFGAAETIIPELTMGRPRPEIQALGAISYQSAQTLQKWATWMMNTNGFDACYRKSIREIVKLGWTPNLVTFDPRTGIGYPKNWNNWDFYPDHTASGEDNMMHFFLAGPIPTRLAKTIFPKIAHLIQPDGWVSPSYDVLQRDRIEESLLGSGRMSGPMSVPYASFYGQPAIAGSTYLTGPGGTRAFPGDTSFLWQLFVRDMTYMDVIYAGQRWMRDSAGAWTWHWAHMRVPELVCGSGWRVIQMFSNGAIADVAPLDRCYDGIPVVIGRNHEQAFRFFCPGDLDHILSKNAAINHRIQQLNLSLDFEANPPVVADMNSGYNFDKGPISAGDVVKKRQGTQIDWMQFRSPSEHHFGMLQMERADVDIITGVHDPLRGERPPGIEAGIAIQSLQAQGKQRVQGKEGAILDYTALLLKKLMVATARKANRRIQFIATDGQAVTVDPEVVESEFGITFVQGSGSVSSREARKSEMRALYELGAIDDVALLEAFEVKNMGDILARKQAAQQQQMLMAALQAKGGAESQARSSKRKAA
jgi:hypothetical protein